MTGIKPISVISHCHRIVTLRVAVKMTDSSSWRSEPFSAVGTDLLLCKVKAREQTIYGSSRNPEKLPEVTVPL